MTCKDLMTSHVEVCTPEDNAVRAAMLMKRHDIGSVPVVTDRTSMKLAGIVTDRDLTLRVVAEQRDYYTTRIGDVMSSDLTTCREDDDYDAVLKAMMKKQIRRVPVVDSEERLVGIISQADVAREVKPKEVAEAVTEISEPASDNGKSGVFGSTGLMIAGGLGIGAGLMYLIDPQWVRQAVRQVTEQFREAAD